SSKFKGCSPLKNRNGLISLKPAIAYFAYTERCKQFAEPIIIMTKNLKFILLFFVINVSGQEMNAEYLKLKKNLLESKTDLFVEFKTYCIGGEFISLDETNDCVYESPSYLFWTKDEKYYKRKFSNCDVFETIEMDNSDFIRMTLDKISEIKNAE